MAKQSRLAKPKPVANATRSFLPIIVLVLSVIAAAIFHILRSDKLGDADADVTPPVAAALDGDCSVHSVAELILRDVARGDLRALNNTVGGLPERLHCPIILRGAVGYCGAWSSSSNGAGRGFAKPGRSQR